MNDYKIPGHGNIYVSLECDSAIVTFTTIHFVYITKYLLSLSLSTHLQDFLGCLTIPFFFKNSGCRNS